MKFSRQDLLDLCEEIATKSYPKHVADRIDKRGEAAGGEFHSPNLGVPLQLDTQDAFQDHIRRTLFDRKTLAARTHPDREVYYNTYTNTLVILTPKAARPGTCYRPDDRGTTFDRILEAARAVNGGTRPFVQPGGVFVLHPELGRVVPARLPRASKQQIVLPPPRATVRLSTNLVRELPPGLILPLGEQPIIVTPSAFKPDLIMTGMGWNGSPATLAARFNAVRGPRHTPSAFA